ncbi:hypothetical protein EG68_06898 [Paragonimus skrjabini miyazakii]|uniref:Uncharacterized protein n=1 Tax=Paragonimus skrjabini miyazakii TaxID=59628 RepID=A0A8S9YM09_9TREM|nr:hypothetical protein EG68_06898 [Paragonimus skrjabini miyazakii]
MNCSMKTPTNFPKNHLVSSEDLSGSFIIIALKINSRSEEYLLFQPLWRDCQTKYLKNCDSKSLGDIREDFRSAVAVKLKESKNDMKNIALDICRQFDQLCDEKKYRTERQINFFHWNGSRLVQA